MTGFRTLLVTALCIAGSAQVWADDKYAAIRDRLELCVGCHGENGASQNPEFPILAGQHFYYLYVQLKDMKSGLRASEVMAPIVADMEKSELRDLATYFSEQTWPNTGFTGDPAKIATGETATHAGECVQCHRGGYEGDSRIPRLAGQHPQYLLKTMLDFKTKARANSPSKSTLMASFSDEDLTAMAEFLADM